MEQLRETANAPSTRRAPGLNSIGHAATVDNIQAGASTNSLRPNGMHALERPHSMQCLDKASSDATVVATLPVPATPPGMPSKSDDSDSDAAKEQAAAPPPKRMPTLKLPLRTGFTKALPFEASPRGTPYIYEEPTYENLEAWQNQAMPRTVLDVDKIKSDVKQALLKPEYCVSSYYYTTGLWQKIARHHIFENVTLGVICVNAVWMAIDTDYNGAETLLQAQPVFQIMEHFFCVYFSFEWLVRFMAFQHKSNCLRDGWFVFDTCLVVLMVLETWIVTVFLLAAGGTGVSGAMGNAAILRLLRLLRLTRLARMLRSMPELLIMIKGIAAAVPSVFFTLCLLLIVMYVFAIIFTQLAPAGSFIQEEYFGNMAHTMYTLLVTGTFLDNMTQVLGDMGSEGLHFTLMFLIFCLCAALTILNMLIGVLCEVVSAVAEREKEDMLLTFIKSKMKAIVQSIDANSDMEISKREFELILEKPEAITALHEVGVDPMALVDFANHIFEDEDGDEEEKTLTLTNFIDVILQFRGCNTMTVTDMITLRQFVAQRFRDLEDRMSGLKPLRAGVRMTEASAGLAEFRQLMAEGSRPSLVSLGSCNSQPWNHASPRPDVKGGDFLQTERRLTLGADEVSEMLESLQKLLANVVSDVKVLLAIERKPSLPKIIPAAGFPNTANHVEASTPRREPHHPEGHSAVAQLEEHVHASLRSCQKLRSRLPLGFTSADSLGGPSPKDVVDLRVWLSMFEEFLLTGAVDVFARLEQKLQLPPSPPSSPRSFRGAFGGREVVSQLEVFMRQLIDISDRCASRKPSERP